MNMKPESGFGLKARALVAAGSLGFVMLAGCSSEKPPSPAETNATRASTARIQWLEKERAYSVANAGLQRAQRQVALQVIKFVGDEDSHAIYVDHTVGGYKDGHTNIFMGRHAHPPKSWPERVPGGTVSLGIDQEFDEDDPYATVSPHDGYYVRIGSMIDATDYEDSTHLQIWQKARLGASGLQYLEAVQDSGRPLNLGDYAALVASHDTVIETTLHTAGEWGQDEPRSADLGELQSPQEIRRYAEQFNGQMRLAFDDIDMARFS